MKKLISLLLMGCICFSMVACGNTNTTGNTTAAGESEPESESSQAVTEVTDTTATEDGTAQAETTEVAATEETSEVAETGENKTLVVYFSNTGNTKAIAEYIADGLSADIYEIVAETPYTDADLDYGDNNSRSTLEMNDPSVRPAITGSVENMEQYDTVYIGYPIWWGEAPRILDTFVESYDFTDKTVIPFCTSASSGMGSSARGLEELAGTGTWLEGQRFSGNESADTVMEWVNGL